MFKSLIVTATITLIGLPVQAMTLSEFNKELSKGIKVMKAENDRLGNLLKELSKEDIDKLKGTYIGDESMTEGEVLVTGADHIYVGLEYFKFYLEHAKSSN